ncbi:TetR/AcrR family transcriptional regulator [Phytohabitans sp. LJ34]|uniref:TetR/AcrR family transcriptional regulator n=1 Tax=Phytohabitans sp. LJ34 TaxID=3452217 RepID=UPI003F8AB444
MSAKAPRERIIEATATLLAEGGRDAVSTRTVCAAAQVQAPAIYRLFGDMQGLLDAVGGFGLASYLSEKAALDDSADPVDNLRAGWDLHVEFGLAQPAFYTLIFGDVRPGHQPPAAAQAAAILADRVHRIAQAGRLRVTEEQAAQLIHSAGKGVTLTLIATPPEKRDLRLSTMARESILATITTETAAAVASNGLVNAAVSLQAHLDEATILTDRERALLDEWLHRIGTVSPTHPTTGARAGREDSVDSGRRGWE